MILSTLFISTVADCNWFSLSKIDKNKW